MSLLTIQKVRHNVSHSSWSCREPLDSHKWLVLFLINFQSKSSPNKNFKLCNNNMKNMMVLFTAIFPRITFAKAIVSENKNVVQVFRVIPWVIHYEQ